MLSRALLLLAVACLLTPVAWGQSVKLPDEIRAAPGAWFIVAPESVDGGAPKWRIDPGLQEVRLDLLFPPAIADQAKGKVFTAPAGRYTIEAWNGKLTGHTADGEPIVEASDIATCRVVVGDPPPTPIPPGPVPPGPIPPGPGPEPPPPNPPVAGSREVVLIRETAQSNPEIARLITSLRSGPHAQYLASKQHRFLERDKDDVGPDGRPDSTVVELVPHWQALTLPVLIIRDATTRQVLYRASLAPGWTGQHVIDLLKQTGG